MYVDMSEHSSSEEVDWKYDDRPDTRKEENQEIVKGDFWLTKLSSKKKIHYYVAEIVDIHDEYTIKYLKKIEGTKNKFLYENDKTYDINLNDIIMKLPKPSSVGGSERQALQLAFSVSFHPYVVE